MSKLCLRCGAGIEEDFNYCPHCGKKHPAISDFDYNKQRNKERNKEWREKNAERRKQYFKQYNAKKRKKQNVAEVSEDERLDRYANIIERQVEAIAEIAKWEVTP